jgi:hemolysin activation/secretion protein
MRSAAGILLIAVAMKAGAAVVATPFAAPEPSEFERKLLGETVFVSRVRVEGVASLPADRIAEAVRPFENRRLGAGEIRELQQKLTRLYADGGYVTSGVVVLEDGIRGDELVLRAYEGTVKQVSFAKPPKWSRPQYLTRLLVPDDEETVHLGTLQERLAGLRDLGVIDQINAELVPLAKLGESQLVVTVEEPRPFGARLEYDNHHAPTLGARRATLWAWHRNLTGWGDSLEARYGDTEGLQDALVSYAVPIPYTRLRIAGRWERSDSFAIDPPSFRSLEIKASSTTSVGELSYALMRRASAELSLFAAYDSRRSDTTLLGIPFSFVPGIEDGKSRLTALRAGAVYAARAESSVLFLRLQASKGDTNVSDDPAIVGKPAKDFTTFFGQLQYARRLPFLSSQAIARVETQYTNDILLPLEKYPLGGSTTVRGYRENLMLRDRAALASLEWQAPITPTDWPWRATGALFADAGWGRNIFQVADGLPTSIYSAGVGLIANGPWGLSARVYYAVPSRKWLTPNDDWQDRGIHFALSWEFTSLIP